MKSDQYIDSIETKLKDIFKNRFNIPVNTWNANNKNKDLLGNELSFLPSYLLYLFFDIEKEFNIEVSVDEVCNGHFNSFNNVLRIIQQQLNA